MSRRGFARLSVAGAAATLLGARAGAAPGPVVAMRLADGTWFGGSRLFGNTRLTQWSAKLVATGPVFGQVDYTYHYEDGNTVQLSARLYEGAAGLFCVTNSAEDRPEGPPVSETPSDPDVGPYEDLSDTEP